MTLNEKVDQLHSELREMREAVSKMREAVMMQAAEVMTTDQVAAVLDVSKSHVYRLMSDKEIPYYRGKGGKKAYFDRKDVLDYMRAIRYASHDETETAAAAWFVNRENKKGGVR